MDSAKQSGLEPAINRFTESDWQTLVKDLLPRVHPVDQNALRIWFAFFPLSLARALEAAPDADELARKLLLQGRYRLRDQVDTSHWFFYGHHFWPEVKAAVTRYFESLGSAEFDLLRAVESVTETLAANLKAGPGVILGITAAAFMTVRQAGLDSFRAAPESMSMSSRRRKKSPEQVLNKRARDDRQGLFGFLRTSNREWTVTFDENDRTHRFKIIDEQEIASGAANDKRPWVLREPRCTVGEGPIPVQCRSASCGTCWVGVLGGDSKLSDVSRRERKAMQQFGYIDTEDPRPLIRLSCQAQGSGAISIVIPPWNGVFGKIIQHTSDVKSPEKPIESPAAVGTVTI